MQLRLVETSGWCFLLRVSDATGNGSVVSGLACTRSSHWCGQLTYNPLGTLLQQLGRWWLPSRLDRLLCLSGPENSASFLEGGGQRPLGGPAGLSSWATHCEPHGRWTPATSHPGLGCRIARQGPLWACTQLSGLVVENRILVPEEKKTLKPGELSWGQSKHAALGLRGDTLDSAGRPAFRCQPCHQWLGFLSSHQPFWASSASSGKLWY